MTLLLRTPAHVATESLLGYVLRVSEVNGYDTPWHVLSLAGFGQKEMRTAGFPAGKLSTVLGRNTGDLEGIAYCGYQENGDRYYKILSHFLGNGLTEGPFRLDKPAFCPHCVAEDGYLDAFWDLSIAVVCPRHGCQLLDACPKCGKKLRWFRRGLLTCECGAAFDEVILEQADHSLVELMAILKAKLHGDPITNLSNSAGFNMEMLEGMSLRSFIR